MHRWFASFFVVLLLIAGMTMPAALSAVSDPVHQRVLANGLQVVVVEDHAAPVVQVAMWYRFGALDELPGKTGLAHGLEHMMFRGTPSLSEGGLDDVTALLGAEANANTANTYTHFYTVAPASRLNLLLRIEADRMRNLSLKEHDWRLERGAVLSEYDGDLGSPSTRLYDDVCKTAIALPLCSLGALGVRHDIVASNAQDLRSYYEQYYRPNNATLVITGDVTPDEAFSLADGAFATIAPAPIPARRDRALHFAHDRRIVEHGDEPYALIDLAYPIPGDLEAGSGEASIFDGVLGNPRSPLYRALILSGLSLGYETSSATNLIGGLEHIFITVAPGQSPDRVASVFRTTLQRMLLDGISPELIGAAKRAAAVNVISSRDAMTSIADRYGYTIGVERRHDPTEDDALIFGATDASVNAFAREHFATPSVVGFLLPMHPKPGVSTAPSEGGVSDRFGDRAPSGPVVEAPWVRMLLAQPMPLDSHILPTIFTLPNGLRCLVQPLHENPTVFISGQIDSDQRFDPPGKEGTGLFAASLLAYGGTRYDFAAQHALADRLGASLEYGDEFAAHGLSHDLPQLLDILADAETSPRDDAPYIGLVRRSLRADVATREQNPDARAGRALEEMLLPPHDPELRRPTLSSLAAITLTDIRAYAHRYFRPDLTTLTIVGDVDPADVRREVERSFGRWRNNGPRPDLRLALLPLPHPAIRSVQATRRLVGVTIAQPSVPRSSPDFVALNLLNEMLGGGGSFDTRLMHELREERGLVYGVSSSYAPGRYRGTLSISLRAAPEHVAAAIALTKSELRRFLTVAPSQRELDRARARLINGTLVAEQATDVIAHHVSTIGFYHLPLTYYRDLRRHYARITPADILAVAKRQLHPDHLVIVQEGPVH